jgi:hypothetical protein
MVYKSFGKFADGRVQYEKWLLQRPEFRIETASPLEMISNRARIFSIVSDFGRIRGLFCGPNGGASSQAAILVLDINCRMPCISTLKYNKVIIASIRCGFSRKRVEASRGVLSTLKLFSTLC